MIYTPNSSVSPGELLRKLRLERHFTQQQTAAHLGITRQAYAYYEHSDSIPDIELLKKLSGLYQLPLEFFFEHFPADSAGILAESSPYQTFPRLYSEFLTFYTQPDNRKKYHCLNRYEKKLLFLSQKLSASDQKELLHLACYKAVPLFTQNPFFKD